MPLITPGFEHRTALAAWESALKNVPYTYLARAYDHAAENWPWTGDKAFTPDAIAQSFTILLVEDRQRAEADQRNAARRNPDTYRCYHCLDDGYQPIWTYNQLSKRWYTSLRPCVCEYGQPRSQAPLQEPEFIRNRLGEYVSRADLEKYGVPNASFKDLITLGEGK